MILVILKHLDKYYLNVIILFKISLPQAYHAYSGLTAFAHIIASSRNVILQS